MNTDSFLSINENYVSTLDDDFPWHRIRRMPKK